MFTFPPGYGQFALGIFDENFDLRAGLPAEDNRETENRREREMASRQRYSARQPRGRHIPRRQGQRHEGVPTLEGYGTLYSLLALLRGDEKGMMLACVATWFSFLEEGIQEMTKMFLIVFLQNHPAASKWNHSTHSHGAKHWDGTMVCVIISIPSYSMLCL